MTDRNTNKLILTACCLFGDVRTNCDNRGLRKAASLRPVPQSEQKTP